MAQSGLSPRKRRFIEALASGQNLGQAAAAVGVSRRQAGRYAADPAIRAALAAAQGDALSQVTRRAVSEMTKALDTLSAIMADTAASPSARVAAARAVLESGLRFTETLDLAERITELEKAVSHGSETAD